MSNATATGGHPRRPGRRQRVIEALVRHGLTERAARALYRLGLGLRRSMLRASDPTLRVEHAGTVNAQTGRRLGPIAVGTSNGVDVDPQLQAAQGHHSCGVHTHPASSSFSPDDARLLIEEVVLDVVAAVGSDGTWYVLSVEPGRPLPTVAHMRRRYAATVKALIPVYQGIVSLRLATAEHAWQALTDETWEIIAPALGLRYDRID